MVARTLQSVYEHLFKHRNLLQVAVTKGEESRKFGDRMSLEGKQVGSDAMKDAILTIRNCGECAGILEDGVGVKLFDRVGRSVHLTDAGRVLLPRARALLLNVEDTRRLLQNTHNAVDGKMRMATSHHVGLHHLAPVLRVFARRFSGVKLDIRFEDSEAAQDMVRRAETELAVVTLDPQGPNGLRYRTLWDDPLVFVVASAIALS